MSAIALILLSIVFTFFSYWISLIAVSVTALRGTYWQKSVIVTGVAIVLNYIWLVGVGLLQWGVLPTHVAFHWSVVLLFTAVVGHGIHWFRNSLRPIEQPQS